MIAGTASNGQPPTRLRVVTYNVYRCQRQTVAELGRFLESLDPDVICLQEILVPDPRRPTQESHAHRLARMLGWPMVILDPCWRLLPPGGNVILTRQPVERSDALSDAEGNRFALAVTLEHAGVEIALICAHHLPVPRPLPLGVILSQFQRTAQIRRSLQWIRNTRQPGIIAGDFNAMPWTLDYRTIARYMTDCSRAVPVNHRNTRPTWGLPAQLDYVFVSDHFRPIACRTIDHDGSDHRPVLVDLELRRSD